MEKQQKDKTDTIKKENYKRLADSEEKKQRRRVPLACLNCKRRKVRCDKQKPCTGCVKNNVGHLCMYLEPQWVDPRARRVAGELEANGDDLVHRAEIEETLQRQQQEIDELRSALARKAESVVGPVQVNQRGLASLLHMALMMGPLPSFQSSIQPPPRVNPPVATTLQTAVALCPLDGSLPIGKNAAVSILTKLNARGVEVPEVADDLFFSLRGFLRARKPVVVPNLYSWLNSIKLDPQLTALWYKITSLQKSYHLYKKGLLSGETRATATKNDRTCGHTQCPVVACEFNFMVEETSQPGTPMSLSVSIKSEALDDGEKLYIKRFNDDSVDLLTHLQKMWLDICNYGRGAEKLSYTQLVFLVDFYLGNAEFQLLESAYELELRHLVRFFAADIMGLVHRDHDDMRLDIAVFLLKMSDAEVYSQLRVKGIHLSLLGLVVDEALDVLRLRSGINDAITQEFYNVFPLEALHQGLGFTRSLALRSVNLFMDLLSRDTRTQASLRLNLLVFVTLLLTLLNRLLSLYKRDGLAFEVRSHFSAHLQFLLEILHNDGSPIQLWMDPARIRLLGANSSHERTSHLRLLFCQIWNDLMRIVCGATFGLVPIIKHNDRLNQLTEEFLLYIGEAEPLDFHYHYLEGLGNSLESGTHSDLKDHCSSLVTSMKNFYSIARASILLRSGIMDASANSRVTLRDISDIVSRFSTWGGQSRLTVLNMTRYFEIKTILNYLLFLFTMLVFLQCEDRGDAETVSKLIPILFAQSVDLNKFLQGSMIQFSKVANSNYVLAVVAENLSLFSHLLAGLLIRFVADTKDGDQNGETSGLLVYSSKLDNNNRIVIPVSAKEEVIAETDRSVNLLESIVGKVYHRRTNKIWKFYMTFIRNSHKMNPAAYAKIHEKAFGSNRLIDSCPVFASPSKFYPVSSVRLELQACPVLHPASPIPMVPKASSRKGSPALNGCPMAHNGSKRQRMAEPKQLCPYSHEALKNNGQLFQESNMRQSPGTRTDEDIPYGGRMRVTPVPLLGLSSLSSWNMMPPVQNTPPSPTDMGMIDWDTLPHFNFDVGDESMVMQISNDLHGSSSIDSMF